MNNEVKLKLENFQEYINYKFKDVNLLRQALTTPRYAKENNKEDYQILETLGDIVIKLIISLKLYDSGIRQPDILTKQKQCLEDKKSFLEIAQEMQLEKYLISSQFQTIQGTKILADIFESICGALFIDSERNLSLIENLIIDRFFDVLEKDFNNSMHFSKNRLLEFLQMKLKFTPTLEFIHEKSEEEGYIKWRVIDIKIFDKEGNYVIKTPSKLTTNYFKSQKEAEKEMSRIILDSLKQNFNKL